MHQCGMRPWLAADSSKPLIPMISDHVGDHCHVLLTHCIPPSPMVCQHMQMNWKCTAPFFLPLGLKTLHWANSNIFTPL